MNKRAKIAIDHGLGMAAAYMLGAIGVITGHFVIVAFIHVVVVVVSGVAIAIEVDR